MFKKLLRIFKNIADYRIKGRTKHTLQSILSITFIGTLCGACGWKEIHEFAVANVHWLKNLIPLAYGIPGVDTLARTISKLDPNELRKAVTKIAVDFLRRSQRRKPGRRGKSELPDVINLDGKTVRGAIKPGKTKSEVHIVNAACGLITMALETVKEKSNEITAIPIVLEVLHECNLLKGKIITIDAMGCQKKIASKITSCGADYLIGLKGNQSGLLSDVKSVFTKGLLRHPEEFVCESYTTPPEKAAGKVEHRVITVVKLASETIFEWLTTAKDWDGIRSVIKIERFNDTDGTSETSYFISSLNRKPSQIGQIQLMHWNVETLHKVLDDRNSFDEDHCKVYRGVGAEILSTMRKLGINLLAPIQRDANGSESRKESFGSIVKLLNLCPHYLEEILTKRPEEIPAPAVWRKRLGDGVYAKSMPILSDFGPI